MDETTASKKWGETKLTAPHLAPRLPALPLQQDLELVDERRDPIRLVAAAALEPISRLGHRGRRGDRHIRLRGRGGGVTECGRVNGSVNGSINGSVNGSINKETEREAGWKTGRISRPVWGRMGGYLSPSNSGHNPSKNKQFIVAITENKRAAGEKGVWSQKSGTSKINK